MVFLEIIKICYNKLCVNNMENLKINYNKIKDLISLREDYWENNDTTNCYAFSLGLDVKEDEIIKNAYQLGVIGSTVKQMTINQLRKLTFEERLLLDLEVMGIKQQESTLLDNSFSWIGKDYIDICWIISLLSNGNNFHFIRKSYDGIWYQKWGYFAPVINYDFDKKIITNPLDANFGEYKLIKTYKLSYREKIK